MLTMDIQELLKKDKIKEAIMMLAEEVEAILEGKSG